MIKITNKLAEKIVEQLNDLQGEYTSEYDRFDVELDLLITLLQQKMGESCNPERWEYYKKYLKKGGVRI